MGNVPCIDFDIDAAHMFTDTAGLAIALACLGLFGLAAHAAAQRTKEIGIRKVLGASVPNLVGLLTRDVVVLVTVAGLQSSSELPEDLAGQRVAVAQGSTAERFLTAEPPEAKFGQLPASDLSSYSSAVQVLTAQIRTVTGLPDHYLGVTSNQPPSADALRATEAGLTARAEAVQASFGRSWETVARLIHAVKNGSDPYATRARVQWADPATRSVAADADATVKLYQSGLLPAGYALARLGYSEDDIAQIDRARRAEALDRIVTGGGA